MGKFWVIWNCHPVSDLLWSHTGYGTSFLYSCVVNAIIHLILLYKSWDLAPPRAKMLLEALYCNLCPCLSLARMFVLKFCISVNLVCGVFVSQTAYPFFMQIIQVPQGKYKVLPPERTKTGPYPVALIPGQFQEYYKRCDDNLITKLAPVSVVALIKPNQRGDSAACLCAQCCKR